MVQIKKQKTGVLIGKFLPFHNGHKYLIDFASQHVETLYVLVCTLKREPIEGSLRHSWMNNHYIGNPDIQVIHVTDENPQYPEEHENFWNIWKKTINSRLPTPADLLFASEDYGHKLAEVIGASFLPVDIARSIVPISGTQIRESPFSHWQYLPKETQSYYIKKICIIGGESTGKTTLTHKLAEYYSTVGIDEYARGYLAAKNNECVYEDIEKIAYGHIASERAGEYHTNKVMFLDTDIITTCVRSEILFKKTPQWCVDYSHEKRYDLYLLLDTDTPWEDDPQRYIPEKRKWLFEKFEAELKERKLSYKIISGLGDERLKNAISSIEKHITL